MLTKKLANIVENTDYEKLPEEVILKAKQCFIDFLAVSLAGSKLSSSESVKNIFNHGNGSSVIGAKTANSLDASLVNGVFAHSLDLDDGHRFAQLHPGCTVIPAVLSLAEVRGKTGEEFIGSIVAGYQVSIIMGMISNPEHRAQGFHSTGTCGTFGAAAASCKTLELGFEKTVNALGLAGTQTAGLLESDHTGSTAKHLHAGKAAQAGVISALLAEKDFSGAHSIIDGPEGFLEAMVMPSCVSSNTNNEIFYNKSKKIIENKKYHIMDVYFKKYPVCRHLHSTIDATQEIYNKMVSNHEKVEDILSIVIKTYKTAYEHSNYNPLTIESVRQSLPVATAITILNGDLNINNIKINSEIIAMASKVILEHERVMDESYPLKRPAKVTIKTKRASYTNHVDLPRGEPEYPFTQQEILQKFHRLNPNVDMEVLSIIDEIESYKICDVMKILNKEFSD